MLQCDAEKHTMTVEAGIWLDRLSDEARSRGLELSVLGSISSQSLAGAISTATHGFGIGYGCISTFIRSLKVLLADGSLVQCSESKDRQLFKATLCGLGATGIIVEATVQMEPIYNLSEQKQFVTFDQFLGMTPKVWSSAQHVRAYWTPQLDTVEINRVNRTMQNSTENWSLFSPLGFIHAWRTTFALWIKDLGLLLSSIPKLPFARAIDTAVAYTVGTIMPSKDRIAPARQIFNFDCGSPQFTFEAAMPLSQAPQGLRSLKKFFASCDDQRPHFPIELRPAKADDIPLSPAYSPSGEPTLWVGIVSYKPFGKLAIPHDELFYGYAHTLYRLGAKPHWAKAHNLTLKQLEECFGKDVLDGWKEVRARVDKDKIFANEYLVRHLEL